ncbi:MAG TPA: hypothetical protein VGI78_13190 [Acetobacteraceae bacterium]|jgi:predicted nucleotidyltransferase
MDQADLPGRGVFDLHSDAVRALCRRCRVRRLDLFGSALTRRFNTAQSDLDMLVTFEEMEPDPTVADGIPDLARIVAFRNVTATPAWIIGWSGA